MKGRFPSALCAGALVLAACQPLPTGGVPASGSEAQAAAAKAPVTRAPQTGQHVVTNGFRHDTIGGVDGAPTIDVQYHEHEQEAVARVWRLGADSGSFEVGYIAFAYRRMSQSDCGIEYQWTIESMTHEPTLVAVEGVLPACRDKPHHFDTAFFQLDRRQVLTPTKKRGISPPVCAGIDDGNRDLA